MIYSSILETVGNTPAVKINNLAPEGINLYVKPEFFNPASSVKDRLAFSIIDEAEKQGDLKPGQTVVEATSGNTGIGLAFVCAAKKPRTHQTSLWLISLSSFKSRAFALSCV